MVMEMVVVEKEASMAAVKAEATAEETEGAQVKVEEATEMEAAVKAAEATAAVAEAAEVAVVKAEEATEASEAPRASRVCVRQHGCSGADTGSSFQPRAGN